MKETTFKPLSKSDFKKYMRQGLGRCALCLETSDNIEKYRETVLFGCLHNLSYDMQCEGTRAEYVHRLTTYFDGAEYFVLPTVKAFDSLKGKDGGLFSHLADLLLAFAVDKNAEARGALDRKYALLLDRLINKKITRSYDFDRDNFERLCINALALNGYSTDTVFKTASDLGRLFSVNKRYDCSDFDWLVFRLEDEIGKGKLLSLLKRSAARDESVRVFLDKYSEHSEQSAPIGTETRIPTVDEMKMDISELANIPIASKLRFIRNASDEETRKLVDDIISEQDIKIKCELLSVLDHRDGAVCFPHRELIEYSRSDDETLRSTALSVMAKCRDDEIVEYALTLLSDEKMKAEALQILIGNYTPEIKDRLLRELYSLKVDYDELVDWHGVGFKILSAKDMRVKLPREFFLYVYETTLCSCCREFALREMKDRRLLTRDIIEECRYDSNSEIAGYVNRYYKK